MTLAGPDALRALDEALRDIRREEDEIVRKLGRSQERMVKIRETEGELLRQFARGRLDEETVSEFAAGIVEAGNAGRQALKSRTADVAAAVDQRRRLELRLGELVAERHAALGEIDRQQTILRGLSPRIAAAIARDPEYERRQRAARELKSMAAEARTKARRADVDRELKGRAYRGDRLFTYLLERGYGTASYRAGPLSGRLDNAVARLADYSTALEHYRMLNALPGRLHAHADQQAVNAVEAEDAIDGIEREAIVAAGGGAACTTLAEAQARTADIDREIVAIQDDRDAVVQAHLRSAELHDAGFERAVNALTRGLGSADLQTLITTARMRQSGVEDPVVSQLNDARMRIVEEQIDARDEHVRLRTLTVRRRELEDIEYELKKLKFDDSRSIFRDDELVSARLNGFLTGETTPASYWSAWRRSQAWSPGTSDWGGGVGLPRHGRQQTANAGADAEVFSRPRRVAAGAES